MVMMVALMIGMAMTDSPMMPLLLVTHTTPPTPAPIVDDDASAVGDPHMHATGDEDFDLAEADLQ